MPISASAPAKIILFGEHAVVYGQPAIAVPVSSLRAIAQVDAAYTGDHLQIVLQDMQHETLTLTSHPDHPIMQLVQQLCQHIGQQAPAVRIVLTSSIPIASGLGSGAATSVSVARALLNDMQTLLEPIALNQIVYEVEKIYHGTPSGIDNTVIVYEQAVYFIKDQPIQRIDIQQPITLIIGDTGQAALTRISVGDVRKLHENDRNAIAPILERIGQIGQQAHNILTNNTSDIALLGRLMDENHTLLQHLTVSSPELDQLVSAARNAGALGAKLSGGGRGGNMIALVHPADADHVKQALLNAGAVHAIETTVRA